MTEGLQLLIGFALLYVSMGIASYLEDKNNGKE